MSSHRPWRFWFAIMGFLGMMVMVAGCGSTTGSSATLSSQKPLVVGLAPEAQLNWWPPIQSATACGDIFGGGGSNGPQPYVPLVFANGSDQIDLASSIASNIAVSHHDTTYTITLNPKWHWSNGTAVTAADVVYDWDLIHAATEPASTLAYCFMGSGGVPKDWQSVVATGAHTLVVTTTTSVNPVWFEHNGLSQLAPIPKSVWDRYPNLQQELTWIKSISDDPLNPVYQVVDGPYRIKKVVDNQYWEYVANPHYDGKTKPAIKTVIYEYEPSPSDTFVQLKSGELAFASLPYSFYQSALKLTNYTVVPEVWYGFTGIALNMHTAAGTVGQLFNNLYIRQAMQMGINQQSYITHIFHGMGVANYSPVPSTPKSPYWDSAIGDPYPYNPSAGKALLEQHGWSMHHGVMEKNGESLAFTLTYGTGSTSVQSIAQLLQESWAQEGIKITLEPMSPQTVSGMAGTPADANKWDIIMGADLDWGYGPDFYPTGGDLFSSTGGYNVAGYDSPTMNQLIDDTYLGGTPSQIKTRLNNYLSYAAQQLPILWLPNKDDLEVVNKDVVGFKQHWNTLQQYVPDNQLSMK